MSWLTGYANKPTAKLFGISPKDMGLNMTQEDDAMTNTTDQVAAPKSALSTTPATGMLYGLSSVGRAYDNYIGYTSANSSGYFPSIAIQQYPYAQQSFMPALLHKLLLITSWDGEERYALVLNKILGFSMSPDDPTLTCVFLEGSPEPLLLKQRYELILQQWQDAWQTM